MEIRSYRRVFDLERRIYSIDQLRLNPGGIPVRGVVYFLALLALSLLVAGVPLADSLAGELPWYMRDIVLPTVGATVLSVIRVEGRTFHLAAHALLRYWLGPRRLAGGCRCRGAEGIWRPPDLVLLPDGSDGRLRRMRYTGPGVALVNVEHVRGGRVVEQGGMAVARLGARRTVTLGEPDAFGDARTAPRAADRAEVISLDRGARLLVRSGS
jgi:hypothetical protein